jgi:hypothetical protein
LNAVELPGSIINQAKFTADDKLKKLADQLATTSAAAASPLISLVRQQRDAVPQQGRGALHQCSLDRTSAPQAGWQRAHWRRRPEPNGESHLTHDPARTAFGLSAAGCVDKASGFSGLGTDALFFVAS